MLAFAYDCAIEAIVCDDNSGRGGWKPRPGSPTLPAFFGPDHEVRNMLTSIGVKSPTEFIGAVTSIEDFAGRIKELIVRTSDYGFVPPLVEKQLVDRFITQLSW